MKRTIIFFITFIGLCTILFFRNETYAILSSLINVNGESDVAPFTIKVNGNTISSMDENEININNIEFVNDHASSTTLAPSSKGSFTLEIDPYDVQVAFYVELNIVDHIDDEDKLLTVTNVELDGVTLSKTNGKYLIFFNLNEVMNKVNKLVSVDIEWVNDDMNNEYELPDDTDFIDISFKVLQYYGQNLDGDL